MVSKDEDKYVIWPHYFDSSLTRLSGRKVAKKHAIEKPTVEILAKAAKSLGLHPVVEKESKHPSQHWRQTGRVLVDKKGSKAALLVQLAKRFG